MTAVSAASATTSSVTKNWYDFANVKDKLAFCGKPDPTGQLYAFKVSNCVADILRGLNIHSSFARGFIRLSTELEPASQIIGLLTAPFMFDDAVSSVKLAMEAYRSKKLTWNYDNYVRLRPMKLDNAVFESLDRVQDRNPKVREFKQLQLITTKATVQNQGQQVLKPEAITSLVLRSISRMSMYISDVSIAIHRFAPLGALHLSPSFIVSVLKITRISAILTACVTIVSSSYHLAIAANRLQQGSVSENERVYFQQTLRKEGAILAKTALKVALLAWLTTFSLIFQGAVNLAVLGLDVYLSKLFVQLPLFEKAKSELNIGRVYYEISASDAVKHANLQKLSFLRYRELND